MKALPTQDRALRKRTALISAASQEFSIAGFDVATAKSIAARAGVATGTFYQYFENKNDILNVIAVERFEFLHERLGQLELQVVNGDGASVVEDRFERILWFVYDFHSRDPELHQVLEQRRTTDNRLSDTMRRGEAVLLEWLTRFVQNFELTDSALVAENLFAIGEGLVHRLVFENNCVEPEKTIHIGAQMIASYFNNQKEINRKQARE